jgi:YVTN family beta-propeller protein
VLDFRLLGVLEVVDGERRLELGGAKQRSVLAILALHRGEPVSTDRLIDQLWGERAPATAAKTVQVYVSHLRKVLGEGAIRTQGRAYMLDVSGEQVDADRFQALAEEGRRALRAGDHAAAQRSLRRALELWRGPALADLAFERFAQAESSRLEEARLDALEDRFDADLALGEHAGVNAELEAAVEANPLRERLQAQLMLALYQSGRQAEALERYRIAQRSLRDELGIEPGPELKDLERRILAHDPDLDPRSKPGAMARLAGPSGPRPGAIIVVIGGVLLLGAAIGALVSGSSGSGVDVGANSVAVIDPASGAVEADVPVGTRPTFVAAGDGGLWVANIDDGSVSKLDPARRTVVGSLVPGGSVDGIGVGGGDLWIADVHKGGVAKVDPDFRKVVGRARISPGDPFGLAGPVAVGAGSVWVGDGNAAIARIDPRRLKLTDRIAVGNDPTAIAIDGSNVWVADDVDGTVTLIDAASGGVITTIPVGPSPGAIALGGGSVWVADSEADQVVRIDPQTRAVTATIAVGDQPTGIAVDEHGVWVANSLSDSVSRIDPSSNQVAQTVELGQSPYGLAFSDGKLWASVDTSLPPVAGGDDEPAATILESHDPSDTDPAAYFGESQRAYATCALLYNYPDQPAPAGSALQPEVAAGPPRISDGGRTYTFEIRPGYRFSPPSGEPVTAASFEREIERVLSPPLHSFGANIIRDIVGARAYANGDARTVRGLTAAGDRLTISLQHPSLDFIARISTPWFCAVPADTPTTVTGSSLIPSAGPYYLDAYVPNQSVVLRRNPNYDGPRQAVLDELDYKFGASPAHAIAAVQSGAADYYASGIVGSSFTPEQIAGFERRYGAHSEAALAGDQRFFVTPLLGVYYLLFNTHHPPFDDPRIRRAVNFAVDRAALARYPFASATGRPTDQFLPPGAPGFSDQAIYPLGGPDLERARALAGPLDVHAVLDVCNLPQCAQLGETVRADLAPLGIDIEVRKFAISALFRRVSDPSAPFDLTQYNYFADYPDPYDLINFLFHSGGMTSALFSDPALDRQMDTAAALRGDRRYRAYAKLDRELTTHVAPAVVYASGTVDSLFSARIGCQVDQPIYGIDLTRLCVR